MKAVYDITFYEQNTYKRHSVVVAASSLDGARRVIESNFKVKEWLSIVKRTESVYVESSGMDSDK